MSQQDHSNKTEAATPKRRKDAAQRGQVAVSPDLTAAVVMLACGLGLRTLGPELARTFRSALATVLPHLTTNRWGVAEITVWSRWFLDVFLGTTAALLLLATGVSLLVTGLQAGLRFSTTPLELQWSRIDPVAGWSRLLSLDGFARGMQALLKLLIAAAVAGGLIWFNRVELRGRSRGTLLNAIDAAWEAGGTLMVALAAGALALALADFLFRRYRFEQELRMSRQEVLDEHKEDQGDPQLRSQRRSRQRDAASRKALQSVPQATMVVTNPTHISVALQYRHGQQGAPRVLAKGKGRLALRIREIATQHGVPILERKPLARALYQLAPVGHEIPAELYYAVAEILAIVYRRRRAA
ncbi:MAG: EscU/YscU/HrcU family type III secretion system export apparatus switch protein [Planctomycetaceae bacterium]|nr:EscU/YscU/HrcU family type III secretion system export apparatus switch protein [Planctomycetaceae bacterium]